MDMRWIAIVIMGGFTLMWASWAFGAGSSLLALLGGIFTAAGVVLLVAAVVLFPRARQTFVSRPGGHDPARRSGPGRIFSIAVLVEVVAIIAAVQLVRHIDTDLIQPVIALIVGAHFALFWFSSSTRSVIHLWMTAAGVATGVVGIAAVLGDGTPAAVHAWVGIAMAAITLTYGLLFARLVLWIGAPKPRKPAVPKVDDSSA